MKSLNTIHKISFGIILLSTLFIGACNSNKGTKENLDEETIEKVRVLPLSLEKIANTFEYTSTLMANEEVFFAPAAPGRIEKINVEVGTRFSEGDLLVVMDQTQLHQAKIQLKTLETDMARFDTLIKTNTIPKQQFDQLKSQLEIAKTNVAFLEKNSMLRAPFSGIVSGKYYEDGEMFSGAPNTQAGKAAVLHLIQINPLKLRVSLTEKLYPIVKSNMEVQVVTDIYPENSIKGKILRIYPTIDQISRSFLVEVSIPNVNDLLRPGMFCRATFNTGDVEALLVPSLAVLKVQGANDRYIFIEENGKAKRIEVKIGRRFDDKLELMSDILKEGDKLIVSGQARLVDGSPIEIVK